MAHQPAAMSVHQKQKGPSKSVHHPKATITHEPLDLQPIKEVFNENTTDDMVTNVPMSHFSAPKDFDHQLDFDPLPLLLPCLVQKSRRGLQMMLGNKLVHHIPSTSRGARGYWAMA